MNMLNMMSMESHEMPLPGLRSDIQLNEAPPELEGAPTWTLYDPAANKYYKIGWLEFECLARFRQCRTVGDLCALLRKETPLDPDPDTVKGLVMFLLQHDLVRATGESAAGTFEEKRARLDKPWWQRALHGYLFFTLPLFKPEHFLRKTLPFVRPLLSRGFMMLMTALLVYGIYLSLQRFDEFATTFMSYLNFEGVVLFLVATIFIKIFHELGHAYVATKYGVPVTVIGVAFIVMYPVLYTETTNAWKLQDRRQRLHIAGAGLMADMAFAAVALLLWHILPPGMLQSLCFMVAVVSLLASVMINLNPLMKFDGYYLFSDSIGIDNLQDRSFAMAKWRLRRWLWGWKDPVPETLSRDRHELLIWFGYAVWIYRFFLYLGIGLLVYHLFFQPLGLILLIVELGFFIGLPILRELKVWAGRADELLAHGRGRIVTGIAVLLLLVCLLPVHTRVDMPAVMHAQSYTRFYSPVPARVDEIAVASGQDVTAGDIIFRLSSPQLEYNIAITQTRLDNLLEIKNSSQANLELTKKRLTIDSEIAMTRQELLGYEAVRDQLIVRAPFAGRIEDMDTTLHSGQWINGNQRLAVLVDTEQPVVSAYVREQDITRIDAITHGTFYPEFAVTQAYAVMLSGLEQTQVDEIFWQELASVQNGPIPAERTDDGRVQPLPRFTYYPATFHIAEKVNNHALPDFVARGTIRAEADPASVASMLIKKTVSILLRKDTY